MDILPRSLYTILSFPILTEEKLNLILPLNMESRLIRQRQPIMCVLMEIQFIRLQHLLVIYRTLPELAETTTRGFCRQVRKVKTQIASSRFQVHLSLTLIMNFLFGEAITVV